ncbi:OmpA family protein [Salipiger sp. H15]|uniref:OmpA family protein n=1 Tax=Alloyangia sp. H15 TaxID=3029062 RepID=A0AAU8AFC3_9RHOB
MTRGLLKSTTMLALAASLAMPVAAQSQQGKVDCAQSPDAAQCQPGGEAKGKDQDKTKGAKAAEAEAGADADAKVGAEADANAGADATLDATGKAAAEGNVAATAEAPDAPAADAPAAASEAAPLQAEQAPQPKTLTEEAAPEQQAQEAAPEAPAAAEVETQAEGDATAEAPDTRPAARQESATTEAAPAADAPAEAETVQSDELKKALEAEEGANVSTTEAAPTAAPEATTNEGAKAQAAETPATEAAPAEQQADGTGSDELKKALEAEQAAEADAEAEAPAPQAETTAAPKPGAEATAGTDAEAAPKAETTADPEAKPAGEAGATAAATAEPEAPSAEEQAEAVAREDEQETTAAAAAGSEESPDDAELVEETLTEADVRSSDEDFATDLRTQAEAAPQAEETKKAKKKKDDDEDGLSNFEKAALVGLGTFALRQILDDGAQVVQNTGDRVVVEQDGQYRVLRNDDVLLRQPGSEVKTYRYNDGSTRTVVAYDDGNTVETIKTADGRVLRRTRILPDGQSVVLFDDTQSAQQVVVSELPQARAQRLNFREMEGEDLAAALSAQEAQGVNRAFSLNQIRNIDRVRHLVPEISVDTVTFQTNSAAIRPGEAEELAALGNAMKRMIEANPGEVFLIEGHTDATGPASYNLALSDRRAESVALALTEYFDVPPENMVLQGYGESDLAVQTQGDERENRRAAVRRITSLLQGS